MADNPDYLLLVLQVLEVQHAFYDAFESRSMDAMDAAWEHSDEVLCTHHGSPVVRG
jgi:hypothetical protein